MHAKDGGVPLSSEVKRRNTKASTAKANAANSTANSSSTASTTPSKPAIVDTTTLEQIEATNDGMVDLETAAMLITDLHHKAAAAAAEANNHHNHHPPPHNHHHQQHGHHDDSSTPYSPDHTTMFDNGVQYLPNGGMSLPQMPWDSFMSHSVRQPKTFSISSSLSGSQGSQLSQLSFNSGTTLQPHNVASVERFNTNGDNLNPVMQQIDGASLPVSGSATPNGGRGLSPFPFLIGPISPVDYRRSPGPSQALTTPKAPQIETDDEYASVLTNIKEYDRDNLLQDKFQLPNRKEVNEFLSTYFNLFHHHLPFLHPESFRPATVASPLLLAVMSIGALYTFNQEQAFLLHIGSKQLVNQFLQGKESFSSRKVPLWAMQSTLINMIFSSWSGDPKGLEWAVSVKSLLANVSVTVFSIVLLLTVLQDGCR